ncbi:MAG TPA: Chromate resistance protein ChrB [Gemmatimonadales bacterium]|jgi:hypothetical protein
MLLASVPAGPAYSRVKLRRRVQRMGALALKGAVYLLPGTPARRADFDLLRDEVVADGGDATIWSVRSVAGLTDDQIQARFDAERDFEYAAFTAEGTELIDRWRAAQATMTPARLRELRADRDRAFGQLEEILRRDYLEAPGREPALGVMEALAVLDVTPTRRGPQ